MEVVSVSELADSDEEVDSGTEEGSVAKEEGASDKEDLDMGEGSDMGEGALATKDMKTAAVLEKEALDTGTGTCTGIVRITIGRITITSNIPILELVSNLSSENNRIS